MRNILCIVFIFLASCGTGKKMNNNESEFIPYIFPTSVVDSLSNKIQKNDKNIFFLLVVKTDTFSIYVEHFVINNSYQNWIRYTNRKIYIDGSFYPLIFELDEIFGTTTSVPEFLKNAKYETYPLINKTALILHGYHIDFDRSGKILNP